MSYKFSDIPNIAGLMGSPETGWIPIYYRNFLNRDAGYCYDDNIKLFEFNQISRISIDSLWNKVFNQSTFNCMVMECGDKIRIDFCSNCFTQNKLAFFDDLLLTNF